MILYREIYKTRMALEDLAADLCKQYNEADKVMGARPAVFFYDHAAGVQAQGRALPRCQQER